MRNVYTTHTGPLARGEQACLSGTGECLAYDLERWRLHLVSSSVYRRLPTHLASSSITTLSRLEKGRIALSMESASSTSFKIV